MIRTSVIIVCWNCERFIGPCLDSLFSQTEPPDEVFVVDNGSQDKTKDILRGYGRKIRLIENRENKGFCAANNQAIMCAGGKYILTLNSDIVLDKEYIRHLRAYLEKHPRAGMAQGKFLRMDRRTIDSLGLHLSSARRLFNLGGGRPDHPRYNRVREIFGPCAAAALYKRELLKDIRAGGEFFDEDFFFLVEDFDVAWRARRRGWKAVCVPRAVCYHYRHSAGHGAEFKQYLSFRNRYFLLIKNESGMRLFFYPLCFMLYDLPRIVFLSFKNPYFRKALSEVVARLPEMRKKRARGCRQCPK